LLWLKLSAASWVSTFAAAASLANVDQAKVVPQIGKAKQAASKMASK
jgi:hypothetical protein